MKSINTLQSESRRAIRTAGFLLLMALFALPAFSQDAKSENVNRVEIKDGKVYVNGEMVKELENADHRIIFSNDHENAFAFFSDDYDGEVGDFYFRSPRFLELKNGNGMVGWVDGERGRALTEFNLARDLEPLHERMGMISGRNFEPFATLFGENEEIRRLEAESREIARKLRNADEGDKAGLEQELSELLGRIFDGKLDAQRERVEKMSSELTDLRDRLQERSDSRRQIIERRLRELKGERDTLDW